MKVKLVKKRPLATTAVQGRPASGLSGSPSASSFTDRLKRCHTVDEVVALFNERYFTITIGDAAKVVIVEERRNTDLLPRIYTFAEFKKKWLPYLFEYRSKLIDVGTIYTRHQDRREYPGDLVFRPTGSPFRWSREDDYNLWRGFACDPIQGDWSLLQAHIHDNVCGGNPEYFDYLLNWMAHLVQYPGRLPGVAVCLHGAQGAGKTAFYKYLAQLFPKPHVSHVTKREHLVGRFNAHLSAKVLVFADEAHFAGDKAIIGELNAIITEEYRTVERKGIDATTEESCVHLIMASNAKWFLQAARDARRFFALNVSSARAQHTDYFDAITAQQNNGGCEAMLFDLLRRDLGGYNPRHVPRTEALREQIQESREPHETWWKERLSEALPNRWRRDVVKKELHRDYLMWMRDLQRHHPMSEELFSKYFIGLYGRAVVPQGRLTIDGRQERVYRFPPLDVCRAKFDPAEAWPEGAVTPKVPKETT